MRKRVCMMGTCKRAQMGHAGGNVCWHGCIIKKKAHRNV